MAVTEVWSKRTYQRGVRAMRVFWIDEVTDEEQATRASGMPSENQSFPLDARLIAGTPEVTILTPGTLFEARVEYTAINVGIGGVPNPLDEPLEVEWIDGNSVEAVDRDADGNPLLNTAHDTLQGVRDVGETDLRVSRWESLFDVQLALAFKNHVNEDSFIISTKKGPYVVNPGQALFRSMTTPPYKVDVDHVYVSYLFGLRADGWDYRFKDQGKNGWWNNNGTLTSGPLVMAGGERVVEDVPLDGNGKPLDTTLKVFGNGAAQTPVAKERPRGFIAIEGQNGQARWIRYKRFPRIAFGGLNLNA